MDFLSSSEEDYEIIDKKAYLLFSGDMEVFNSTHENLPADLPGTKTESKASNGTEVLKVNPEQSKSAEQSKESTEQLKQSAEQLMKNPEHSKENPEHSKQNAASIKEPTEAAKSVKYQSEDTEPKRNEISELQQRLDSIKCNLNRSLEEFLQKCKTGNGKKLSDILCSVEENLATAKNSVMKNTSNGTSTMAAENTEPAAAEPQSIHSDVPLKPQKSENHRPSNQKSVNENQESQKLCHQCQALVDGKPKSREVSDLRAKVVEQLVFELTKKVYDIHSPFLGPDNERTAYQFLKAFEFVFSSVADEDMQKSLCFRQLLSEGIDTDWVDYEPYDTPYTELRDTFLWRHFGRSVQNEIYEEFKRTSFEESELANCVDYVGYWINKLEGVDVIEESLVETFIKNLPEVLQKIIYQKNPKTLMALKQMIRDLPMDIIVLASAPKHEPEATE